jgi:hypothetical protein
MHACMYVCMHVFARVAYCELENMDGSLALLAVKHVLMMTPCFLHGTVGDSHPVIIHLTH